MKTSGNTVLITGGATGIGLSLAEYFLREKNEVIICGRRESRLQEARAQHPGLHVKVCDVTDEAERAELIDWTVENFPSFNVLINNAGIQQMLDLKDDIPNEVYVREVMTNIIAPVHLAGLATPQLMRQAESAIVNVTSGLAFVPLAHVPLYCATKAALHSFSISQRHQLRNTPVKVFELIPPMVDTELGGDTRDRQGLTYRGIRPEEVSEEFLRAMAEDRFECAVENAANLYRAGHSEKAGSVFEQMNSR